jgi:hypothetical protein
MKNWSYPSDDEFICLLTSISHGEVPLSENMSDYHKFLFRMTRFFFKKNFFDLFWIFLKIWNNTTNFTKIRNMKKNLKIYGKFLSKHSASKTKFQKISCSLDKFRTILENAYSRLAICSFFPKLSGIIWSCFGFFSRKFLLFFKFFLNTRF